MQHEEVIALAVLAAMAAICALSALLPAAQFMGGW
jgi:hypothetical protein